MKPDEGSQQSYTITRDLTDPGVLRLDFPGGAGDASLEQISWDERFETFDSKGLALPY